MNSDSRYPQKLYPGRGFPEEGDAGGDGGDLATCSEQSRDGKEAIDGGLETIRGSKDHRIFVAAPLNSESSPPPCDAILPVADGSHHSIH